MGEWKIEPRLRIRGETVVAHVARHTDDFRRRLQSNLHMLADDRLVRPEAARERLIGDHYLWRRGRIRLAKVATGA